MANKDYHHNADTMRVINPQLAALFRYYLLINDIQKSKKKQEQPSVRGQNRCRHLLSRYGIAITSGA